jgi:hypothetical protein
VSVYLRVLRECVCKFIHECPGWCKVAQSVFLFFCLLVYVSVYTAPTHPRTAPTHPRTPAPPHPRTPAPPHPRTPAPPHPRTPAPPHPRTPARTVHRYSYMYICIGGGGRGQKAKDFLIANGFKNVVNGGGPEDAECWAVFGSK